MNFKKKHLLQVSAVLLNSNLLAQEINSNWCQGDNFQLISADFNGDGQNDRMCVDKNSGFKWIAIKENGTLMQRWSTMDNWCSHRDAEIYVADVNGDKLADLVCKDPERVWVDYGSSNFFGGTDFFVDTNFCSGANMKFEVADVSLDGKADLLCNNPNGTISVDVANPNGRFTGSSDFTGVCQKRNVRNFSHSEPGANHFANSSGTMKYGVTTNFAEEEHATMFIQTHGFASSESMGTKVTIDAKIITSALRMSGLPGGGYSQVGAELILEVKDATGAVKCKDVQELGKHGLPGAILNTHLQQPRDLSCRAHLRGNYTATVTLHGWSISGGFVNSSNDAHLQVTNMTLRECRAQ